MTRLIVWLLLLANLALFSWMRWGSELTVDADAGSVQPPLHPEKITLLETTLAASAATTAPGITPGLTLTLSPIPAPAVSAPVPIPVVPTPAPVPAPTPAPISAVTASTKLSNCAEWGEFSGNDLSRAQQALSVLKLGDSLTKRAVERNHGYWVYIPPLSKRANVEKKIAQLKERGVEDFFVVQEKGKWLNAISLGVFKTKDAAQKYIDMLRAKGVHSAKLGERVSKLKYTVFLVKDLDSGTTDKLNALQKEFPDSELRLSACTN